jgi:Zn/Cd-binding protein ZinT
MDKKTPRPGYREVFCRYIRRNGKIIYPKKAKAFHFFVKCK